MSILKTRIWDMEGLWFVQNMQEVAGESRSKLQFLQDCPPPPLSLRLQYEKVLKMRKIGFLFRWQMFVVYEISVRDFRFFFKL